ncbi:MAG: acetyltransferase [Bacteroidota bacterium]
MQNKKAIIIGAGTYGEVFLTYLRENKYEVLGFFDDTPDIIGKHVKGLKVLGTFMDLLSSNLTNGKVDVFCSIGDNAVRTNYLQRLSDLGLPTPNLIHKSVVLNEDIILGKGITLMPGAIIMPYAKIEDFSIVSMGSKIAHHSVLKKGAFISSGVTVGANIVLGERTLIGVGSTIMTGVKTIGKEAIVGAGAVVIRDVPEKHVVAGVPAKTIKVKT